MPVKYSYQKYQPEWGIRPTAEVQPMSIYDMFRQSALQYPKKPALIFLEKTISYVDLDRMVTRFAVSLAKLGIKKRRPYRCLAPQLSPTHHRLFLLSAVSERFTKN